jgi:hypothetical protein
MQRRPKILIKYGRINAPLRAPLFDLTNQVTETFLTSDTVSGVTTIKVKDPTNIRVGQILFIGKDGVQGSEIAWTTLVTAGVVTLDPASQYPHSATTPIKVIDYDQIEFSYANTVGGTKNVLVTTEVVAGAEETQYTTTTIASGVAFYFARFKNSVTGTFSEYSDPAPYGGYTQLSARSVIDSALGDINKKTSEILSDEYAFQQINNCQMEVLRELKRWSWMQEFDSNLGNTTLGGWKIALPTNCDDQNTNKSIWNFRIGTQPNMTWVDKAKWDEMTYNVSRSKIVTNTVAGMSFVTLTDTSDFDDSGAVLLSGWSVDYTANNRTLNKLTLTTTLVTAGVAGAEVFQGVTSGTPRYWTTFGGYIYHYPIISATYKYNNYYLDYYKALTSIVRDSDTIVIPDPTVVQYYLEWKFLRKLNNGSEDEASKSAQQNYLMRREKLKQKEVLGRTFRLKPLINSMNMNSGTEGRKNRIGSLWVD